MPLSSDISRGMDKQKPRTPSPFAQRVEERRLELGMGVNELAELAGMNGGNLSKMLSGERAATRPPADTVRRLAVPLKVSEAWLLDGATIAHGQAPSESSATRAQAIDLLGPEAIPHIVAALRRDPVPDPDKSVEEWAARYTQLLALSLRIQTQAREAGAGAPTASATRDGKLPNGEAAQIVTAKRAKR